MDRKEKTKKKNIALLLPALSGGGAERVASELSQFFAKEGHNVFIFTKNRRTGYIYHGKITLLKSENINQGMFQEISSLYILSKELRLLKKKFNIDVSISFMEEYNLANILSKVNEKVIVRVCTTLSARKDLKGLYYNKVLLKYLYNKADKVVVLSKYGKIDLMRNYGIKRNKLIEIPNAVFPRTFDDNITWKYGNKVILSVNRIHPVKQQGIMIDVIENVIKTVPEAKLLFVGYDINEYANKLKNIVQRRGLENYVIFTGHVNNVEYYMYHSQILLSTSITEGFPNVVVEAMNQGLPVISIDYPGPPRDILGVSSQLGYGKYGVVLPMIDENRKDEKYEKGIAQLCSVVEEMLTNVELWKKYSEASKKRSQYYRKDKVEMLWRDIL